MTVDLAFFREQIYGAIYFSGMAQLSLLVNAPREASQTIPGVDLKALHEKSYELVPRMAYIYAWSAFETLMESCIIETLRKEPQHLVEQAGQSKGADVLRRLIVEGKSRDDIVEDLIEREIRGFQARTVPEQADYFHRVLEVDWSAEQVSYLKETAAMRNDAAHKPEFHFPESRQEDMLQDLLTLAAKGEAIAMSCIRQHALPYKAPPPVKGSD